jgi:hypothetical protein
LVDPQDFGGAHLDAAGFTKRLHDVCTLDFMKLVVNALMGVSSEEFNSWVDTSLVMLSGKWSTSIRSSAMTAARSMTF